MISQGFSAQIPESYLQRLQAFQGSVIDYIGRQTLFSLAPSATRPSTCPRVFPRIRLRGYFIPLKGEYGARIRIASRYEPIYTHGTCTCAAF